jgi:hypothetical protein
MEEEDNEFLILILITNICCVIDCINYYIIAKRNGIAAIKLIFKELMVISMWPNHFGAIVNKQKALCKKLA